jgi:RHS repeat-associated protein
MPLDDNSDDEVDGYLAKLVSSSDYSPFGVQLDGRTFSSSDYRYGFNGMEQDNEIKGEGNSYTTEFRQYDPRIGRWLSIDPLFQNFPWQSPYVAYDNNPIVNNDPKGGAAESQTGGPQERRQKLTIKRSTELMNNGKSKKWHRLDNRITKLNNKLNGGNNGLSTQKKANFGRGGGDTGENTLTGSHTFEPTTLTENFGFNLTGFKGARLNEDGKVEVFQVGSVMDGAEFPPVPRWPAGNAYGQPEGSRVLVDNGNIMDDAGNVLIPKLEGVDPNDGLYQKGEVHTSGRVMAEDGVIRLESIKEKDSSGTIINISEKRSEITGKIETENK